MSSSRSLRKRLDLDASLYTMLQILSARSSKKGDLSNPYRTRLQAGKRHTVHPIDSIHCLTGRLVVGYKKLPSSRECSSSWPPGKLIKLLIAEILGSSHPRRWPSGGRNRVGLCPGPRASRRIFSRRVYRLSREFSKNPLFGGFRSRGEGNARAVRGICR